MILPTKHIAIDQSLIGLGAYILTKLDHPMTISTLWQEVRHHEPIGSYDKFIITVDLLYAVGAISFDSNLIKRAR